MTWIPLLSLVISVVAVTASALFGYLTLVDRRVAAKLSREGDLHQWVQTLADVFGEIRSGDEIRRKAALTRLSLQIDYGRMFFPNEENAEALKWHPTGRRSSILDPLVEVCQRASRGNWDDAKIAADWREFIDQIRERTTAFQIDTSPEASGKKQYRNP